MSKKEIETFISNYIEKKINPRDLWSMSRTRIIELAKDKFKDYSEKEIEDILNELILEERGRWIEKETSFRIVYPKNKKDNVRKNWEDVLLPFENISIIAIVYLIILIATYYVKREFLGAALLIPIILFIGYNVIISTYKNFEKNFKILGKNRLVFITCYIGGLIIAIVILWVTNFSLKEILIYGFTGGITIGTIIYQFFNLSTNIKKRKKIK